MDSGTIIIDRAYTEINRGTRVKRRLLRKPEVSWRTGYSVSWIEHAHKYDPTFPRKIGISPRAVGWYEHEIDQWIANRERANVTVNAPPRPKPKAKVRARL